MKKKTFSKVKAVKLNARNRVGIVPSTKIIPDKRGKVKHKKPEGYDSSNEGGQEENFSEVSQMLEKTPIFYENCR